MAHVQIRQGDAPYALQVVVDGVDMSKHVFAEGFGLVRVGDDEFAEWGVRMIITADVLDVDLPDAVVEALRAGDDS